MSTSLQAKPITWNIGGRWARWRILNAAILLFAFLSPWETTGPNGQGQRLIYSGFQMLYSDAGSAFAIALGFALGFSERIRPLVETFLTSQGLLALLAYCVLSVVVAVFGTRLVSNQVWAWLAGVLLILAATSLLLTFIWYWPFMLAGFWLACIGFLWSIVLEVRYYLSGAE